MITVMFTMSWAWTKSERIQIQELPSNNINIWLLGYPSLSTARKNISFTWTFDSLKFMDYLVCSFKTKPGSTAHLFKWRILFPSKTIRPLVIQLKYCPVLPSLNKVDYYYYWCEVYEIIHIWTVVVDESKEWSSQ